MYYSIDNQISENYSHMGESLCGFLYYNKTLLSTLRKDDVSMRITNSDQDSYRQRLFKMINERGTKYVFVATQIGLPPYVMSGFRHGRNIWDEHLMKLDEFLISQGY